MVTGVTDAELIRGSLAEPGMFATIFDRHFDAIHRFLDRRVGWDSADPLTGETFRIAFEKRGTYQLDRPESLPWLYGIANNVLRHNRRRMALEERSLGRIQSRTGATTHPHEALVDRLAAQGRWPTVESALRAMRPEDRDVILLVAWEDLTYDEVAVALGIPIGTVRSRLHRARRQLRELIPLVGQEEDDNPTTRQGRYLG